MEDIAQVSHERWGKAVLECSLVRTKLQKVFRKLNEDKILISPKDNEITQFWDDAAMLEGEVQLQAFDGMESRRMERYESLK